jgi:hypothetical protein
MNAELRILIIKQITELLPNANENFGALDVLNRLLQTVNAALWNDDNKIPISRRDPSNFDC